MLFTHCKKARKYFTQQLKRQKKPKKYSLNLKDLESIIVNSLNFIFMLKLVSLCYKNLTKVVNIVYVSNIIYHEIS